LCNVLLQLNVKEIFSKTLELTEKNGCVMLNKSPRTIYVSVYFILLLLFSFFGGFQEAEGFNV